MTQISTEPESIEPQPEDAKTVARLAVRNSLWVTIGSYANQVLGFVAILVLTRLLNPDIFGFFSLGTFWFSLLNIRTKVGVNYAAIQQRELDGRLLGTFFTLDALTAGAGFLLSLIAALVFPLLGYAPQVSLALVALMTADSITSATGPLAMALEKEMQLSRVSFASVLGSLLGYGAALGLALGGAGLWSLLAINFLTAIVGMASSYIIVRRRMPLTLTMHWQFDRTLAKRLISQGLATGLSLTALGTIVNQFDNFLVGTFVSPTTLGYYDRAYRIAHWPNLLLTVTMSRIAFLTFSKVRDDMRRLTHAVRLAIWAVTTFGIPIVLILLFGATDIVSILYGSRWAESAHFLRYLTIYSVTWPVVSIAVWLSISEGKSRITVGLTLSQAVIIVLAATPLTLAFGATGTVIGVVITMISSFIAANIVIFREVPLSLREVYLAPFIAGIVALATNGVFNALTAALSIEPLVRLTTIAIISAGVFWLVLFIIRPTESIERVKFLASRFRKNT
ncbi:MAG: oligosaccharide flippase family protein [Chloroflexi bacterium]|nr:oligosaccharide flippase family protein [Chloroflexota bacterium]MCL5274169.1 oligosaccharide flippase family protein [Chloroflexota bacterium]